MISIPQAIQKYQDEQLSDYPVENLRYAMVATEAAEPLGVTEIAGIKLFPTPAIPANEVWFVSDASATHLEIVKLRGVE